MDGAVKRSLLAIAACLEKEREQRFQSAAEVGVALEELRRAATPLEVSSQRRRRVAVASLAVLLIAGCAVFFWWWRSPLARFAFKNYRMTALTSTGNVAFAEISPDGRYLAYADEDGDKQSLWVRQLATSGQRGQDSNGRSDAQEHTGGDGWHCPHRQQLLIGMKACGGTHFLGRALRTHGHDARLMPAQFVKGDCADGIRQKDTGGSLQEIPAFDRP